MRSENLASKTLRIVLYRSLGTVLYALWGLSMNHSRGSRASLLGTRWCCQPLAYRIEGQIGCAPDQPNPFFVHGDGREKVWRGLLMLFEAHGRQNKSSNDESYVGSEARFSERAASQYTESPAAPMSARAFFEVFPRSSSASESP